MVVDLSPTITEDLPARFWGTKALDLLNFRHSTQFAKIVNDQGTYVQNSYWTLMNHGGPHLDAPRHFDRTAKGVDAYELSDLIGRVHLIDYRTLPRDEPIPRGLVEDANISPGHIVLVLVGYEPPQRSDELPSYPYLSKEAADYLAQLPVKGIGTDALSVECIRCFFSDSGGLNGYEELAPVHHAFLTRGIPVFEQLVNVEALVGQDHAVFVGFPLKVKDGDGSPIRAAALVY
jgi:kynurenine formamidase